ncbi:hypothetical protein TcCL_ESM11960, partial [Trypanosoma cruzi]
EVGRLLGLCITCFVLGYVAVAKGKLHSCVRYSVLRAGKKGYVHNVSRQVIQNRRRVLACFHDSTRSRINARCRGKSLGEYRTLHANTALLCIGCGASISHVRKGIGKKKAIPRGGISVPARPIRNDIPCLWNAARSRISVERDWDGLVRHFHR